MKKNSTDRNDDLSSSEEAAPEAEIPKDLEQQKKRLIDEVREYEGSPWVFWVRKSKLTFLLIAALLVFGLTTITEIPKELNPEVEIPIALVMTPYPGASPLDVEEQVTKELESELSDLSGVKRMDSSSSLGFSSITVEFEAGEDLDESIDSLKDKVERAKPGLPEDAEDPQVMEININDQPIVEISLTSDQYDVADLKDFAEDLKDRVKGVPFVSEVVIVGGGERIIDVEMDQEKLSQMGLSVSGVVSTLKANNVNFPLGSIELDSSRYNIRVAGKFQDAFEVASLPIGKTINTGQVVYLEDVAQVREGFAEETSRSRFSQNGSVPTEAVSLQVYKKTGGDVTGLAKEVRNRIEEGRGEDYPEEVTAEVTNDMSVYVEESIGTLVSNGSQTVILILILLFIFLGWKEALLAGLSIPFSFFIAFIAMSFMGVSFNFISLFSLVLALGILVDSAIVIVEGIYERVAKFGLTGYQAAISTIREFFSPLFSGMLTTVAAFFPLLFVEGIFGQFMRTIPMVVIATLFSGLFVAVSIVPAVASYLVKPVKVKEAVGEGKRRRIRIKSKPRKERWASRTFSRISGRYYDLMPEILQNKSRRRWLIWGGWAVLLLTFILPISGFLKTQAFGQEDGDWFYINLKLPSGTVLERTDKVSQKLESQLREVPEIENFASNVGASIGADGSSSGGNTGSSNRAFIRVNLIDTDERERTSQEIVTSLREELERKVTEGEVSFLQQESGPPAGEPVEVRVAGPDLLVLEDLAEEIKAEVEKIPTTIDIKTSLSLSPGEFVFIPNREVMAQRGLSVIQVAGELRNAIAGNDSTDITREGEEIKISVEAPDEQLSSIEDLRDLTVTNQRGEVFAISELGEVRFSSALSTITRRDNERIVAITADTEGGNAALINQQLRENLEQMQLPSGYQLIYGGEAQELQAVYIDMLLKMFLGVLLIIFILVLQFNSYKQMLLIVFTIPLALIGVFWGMTIFRMTLDIPAFIGIVSLSGIVVNDAIILIDQINKERGRGKKIVEAARSAGKMRFQPIFLTTITTVFGLLPLSISEPIWRNLGASIIFGLTFSTMLTLVIIPTAYVSFHAKDLKKEGSE